MKQEETQMPRIKIFTCTNLIKSYALNKYASSLKVYIIQFTDPDQAIWAQKVCRYVKVDDHCTLLVSIDIFDQNLHFLCTKLKYMYSDICQETKHLY